MAKNWNLFPSPRGDELQQLHAQLAPCTEQFPSPHGDELQPRHQPHVCEHV